MAVRPPVGVGVAVAAEAVPRPGFLRLGAGAVVAATGASCGVLGEDFGSAEAKTAASRNQTRRTLRIAQVQHFIPAYDSWFGSEHVVGWGERNEIDLVDPRADLWAEMPAFPAAVPDLAQLAAADATGKYGFLADAASWTPPMGHPGTSNAAIDEIANSYLIPRMFAAAARGEKTPEQAVADAAAEARPIFDKWRERGKI